MRPQRLQGDQHARNANMLPTPGISMRSAPEHPQAASRRHGDAVLHVAPAISLAATGTAPEAVYAAPRAAAMPPRDEPRLRRALAALGYVE